MKRLLFLGSTVADVILRTPALPQSGDDLNLLGQSVSLGGCAYNACRAAMLLYPREAVTLLSPVGSGLWGDWVYRGLSAEGLADALPCTTESNGCCYCLVEPDGERTFLCQHGAEYRFQAAWLDKLGASSYDSVYLCGLEVEEATGDVLLDYLEQHPPRRLYFAPGARICAIPPQRMARLIRMRPVLHLNEQEAVHFAACVDVEDAVTRLHTLTEQTVVVTLGARGALVADHGEQRVIPGYSASVCDTIGAGDAHIGAVMACEASGEEVWQAVQTANAVAAAVVEQQGAQLSEEAWQMWQKTRSQGHLI